MRLEKLDLQRESITGSIIAEIDCQRARELSQDLDNLGPLGLLTLKKHLQRNLGHTQDCAIERSKKLEQIGQALNKLQ